MQGEPMSKKTEESTEEWIDITLVPGSPLEALRPGVTDTVMSPDDLALLPDVRPLEDGLEGACSGCGEPIVPGRRGGWAHVGLSDPWCKYAGPPLGPVLEPAEPPAWLETCTFGHAGSRVNACDRDAVEGSQYCVIHIDL